jgi:RNA polymerase sigma-70 factor (ECF subfamily)
MPMRVAFAASSRFRVWPARRRPLGQVINAMIRIETYILVERARHGDRDAYDELVRRFETKVFALAMKKLGQPVEAQELTQEVFVRALHKIGQLRDANAFGAWLRQITVRMAINRLTRRGRFRSAGDEVWENAAAPAHSPLDAMVRAEQRTQVHEGLDRLKPVDRATLEGFYLHGLSIKELSESFAVPEGTIKRRLHVARERLREELDIDAVDVVATESPMRARRCELVAL